MKKKKSFWIKLTALALVAALSIGTGLFFLLHRRPTIKIASRTEIIKLWDEQGITKYFADTLRVKVKWLDYGAQEDLIYRHVGEDLGREPKDLPDAYLGLGLSSDEISLLASQDAFLNFEHMKSHTPNLQAIINSDTARVGEFKFDGKLISMPCLNEQYGEAYPQKAWINQEWLLKAKLSMPDTPQEFLAVLRAFKDMSGKAPLGVAYGSRGNMTTLGFLVHAFVTTDYDLAESNYLNVDGLEIYAGVTRPGYKEALKYLNTLYKEGLVDANLFEQGGNIFMGNARGSERYGVIFAKDLNALFNDAERASDYVPLPPLKNGSQCSTLARYSEIKLGGYMVPARTGSERQALALRFGDAMLDRAGTLTVCFGSQNVGWFDADAGSLAMGADTAIWKQADGGFDNTTFYSGFMGEVPYWMNARLQTERQAPQSGNTLQNAKNWQGYLNRVTKDYYEPVGRANIKNILPTLVPTEDEMARLHLTDVSQYLTRASRDFVTGKADIDAGWDTFVDTLNQKGLSDIVRVIQDVYNREK